MTWRNLSISILALFILGCASTKSVSLKPLPKSDQGLLWKSGAPFITSLKTNFVTIGLVPELKLHGNRIGIALFVSNQTDQIILLTPDIVSVMSRGNPLKVFTYDELKNETLSRKKKQALGLALQSMGAGFQGKQIEQEIIRRRQELLATQRGDESLPILRTHSLLPKKAHFSLIVIDLPEITSEPTEIVIDVSISNEVHSFSINAYES